MKSIPHMLFLNLVPPCGENPAPNHPVLCLTPSLSHASKSPRADPRSRFHASLLPWIRGVYPYYIPTTYSDPPRVAHQCTIAITKFQSGRGSGRQETGKTLVRENPPRFVAIGEKGRCLRQSGPIYLSLGLYLSILYHLPPNYFLVTTQGILTSCRDSWLRYLLLFPIPVYLSLYF